MSRTEGTPAVGQIPMRVLVVSPPLDSSGGIGRLLGYELAEMSKRTDVEVSAIDSRGSHSAYWSPLFLTLCIARLITRSLLGRVDVVHVNFSKKASTWRKLLVVYAAKVMRRPVVVQLHSGGYPEFISELRPKLACLVKRSLRHADRFVVLGQVWADFAEKSLGIPSERIRVVPNGVPGLRSDFAHTPRVRGALTVTFVGRLNESKGVYDLLAAASVCIHAGHDIELRLAGDGDANKVVEAARPLGISSRVRVDGWLDEEGVAALLAESDVFALPSYVENQPMSILEAMSVGLPIISTPVGSIPEVVGEDGKCGWLIEPGDRDQLSRALADAASRPGALDEMSKNSRSEWQQRFDISVHTDALVRVWRDAYNVRR